MDKYEQQKQLQSALSLGIRCIKKNRDILNSSDDPDKHLINQHDDAIRTLQSFVERTK